MIEYSFVQFIGLYKMLMEFCDKHKLSDNDMFSMQLRLYNPLEDGSCKLDVGFPPQSKKRLSKPPRAFQQ